MRCPAVHAALRRTALIKSELPNSEIPASFAGVANLLGKLKVAKLSQNVALLVRHERFHHPKLGNLQIVFREPVHIYP